MNETKQPLLSRKLYEFEINYSGQATPSNELVKKKLSEQAKTDINLIKIKKIDPAFGEGKAKVTTYIYDSKEAMEKFEGKVKEVKKEEQPAQSEQKPAEQKTEEPKEEKSTEQKTEKSQDEKK